MKRKDCTKKKWNGSIATGSAIPTGWLLIDTAEMVDYLRTGVMHVSKKEMEAPKSRKMHGSTFYIKWPDSMGDVWCLSSTREEQNFRFQVYGSEYGYIRVEWSDESILIDVREASEMPRILKQLTKAGWEPEVVGVLQFIRCKRENVPHDKNRWT